MAVTVMVFLCCVFAATAWAADRQLMGDYQKVAGSGSADNPKKYSLDISVGKLAPDCVERKVILVNGQFQPTLTLTQGDWVEITVKNSIPSDWPSTAKGISIHWHGFSMKGFAWMDGTRHVSQCPIPAGSSFTYKFQVNEMPGTYFYHDHAQMNRADGLQGPLIVQAGPGVPPLDKSDASSVLFLTDWWHETGNSLAMRLNRPFDPTQATPESGAWCWVGVPRSLLINGKGNYKDCEDVYKRKVGEALRYRSDGVVAAAKDLLAPNGCVAGQLGPTAEPSSCSVSGGGKCGRPVVSVKAGSTQRLRIVNAGSLVYMTVCIEKHSLTVVAMDAAPVEPKAVGECVDVNTGQRVDVLVKADQQVARYWISVGSQYRKGAPSAYGVLKYDGSKDAPNPANIIQPGKVVELKWNISNMMAFKPNPLLLASDAKSKPKSAAYLAPKAPLDSFKLPSTTVDKRYVIQSTQPLIQVNGILRWALDNVAHAVAPPCRPQLDQVYDNVNWAADNALDVSSNGLNPELYFSPKGGNAASWEGEGKKVEVIDAASPNAGVVLKLGKPGAGTHVITAKKGEIIELVVQNDRAGLFGGEYASANETLTNKRNGREQHSFHLHGHHFWQVGMGLGEWTPDKVDSSEYNVLDPILRDTTTVLFNGTTEDKAAWVAFRFVANNPGVWPMHCHIAWHEFMGQGITIIEDPAGIAAAKVPTGMPTCPSKCVYTFANFNPKAAEAVWGKSGLLAPATNN